MKEYYEYVVSRLGETIGGKYYENKIDCLYDLCKVLKSDAEAYWGKMYFVSNDERTEVLMLEGQHETKGKKIKLKLK